MLSPYILSCTTPLYRRFILGCMLLLLSFNAFAAAISLSSISISSAPANAAAGYIAGEVVTATAVFSANATVVGSPTLSLNIGGTLRTATYSGGTGTKNLTFVYTVVPADVDLDGISINANSLALNGGSIKNGTTIATITHAAVAASAADPVNLPGVATNISTISLTSTPADAASYHTGEVIAATVSFVNTAGGAAATELVTGTPTLQLDIGGVMRTATYVSGSGTANLVFNYTVVAADVDLDGVAVPANALSLNGGTINNGASSPMAATLTHAAVAASAADKVALPSTAPVLRSAFGAGSTITLNYDVIDSGFSTITPAAGVFSFIRNNGVGPQLSVTSVVVDPVARTVSLGLNGLIDMNDTGMSVSYTPNGTNDIQNVAGDKVAAFSNFFVANAMPRFNVNANRMVFNNGVLKAGTGLVAGSKYLYTNAITVDGQAIDVVVTISAITAGTTITGVDGVVGTDAAALTGMPAGSTTHADMFSLNTSIGAAGGDATFLFEFIKSGTYGTTSTASTGVDVILENVAMNSYDLDTSGGTMRQYQDFGGFATYTVSTTSKLNQTQYPGYTHFQANATVSANVTQGPGTVAGDDIRVMALYEAIHSFSIKTGETASGGTAYYYIDFSIGPAWASGTGGVTYQVPTVNPRITNVTTPVLTGTFVGNVINSTDKAYKLTITLNGKTYVAGEVAAERTTLANGDIQFLDATTGLRGVFSPTTGLGTWSITVPVADALPQGTYNVVAQVDYGPSLAGINKNTVDTTTNELVINAVPADVIAPTLTKIERLNPLTAGITPAELAMQNYVDFKVTFSEAVTNVGVADFQIIGAGSTGGILSSATQSSPTTYTVRISAIPATNLGLLDLNLKATTDVVDLAGNNLSIGTPDPVQGVLPSSGIDETYTIAAVYYDYADAPSGVTVDTVARGYGSATHLIPASPLVYLGTTLPDADTAANQTSWQANVVTPAMGDDAGGGDEGIAQLLAGAASSFPVLTAGANSYALTLVCRGTTTVNAISGWIDFNKNGTFDTGELAQGTCSSATATAGTATLTWSGLTGLKTGVTFARFRIASVIAEVATPNIAANDGEVEDYALTIRAGVKLVVTATDAGKFNLTLSGGNPAGGTNPANDVVSTGTTGFVGVDAGATITLQQVAGTANDLANYTTTLSCVQGDGTTVVTTSSVVLTGATRSGSVIVPALNSVGNAAQVVCTFANATAGVSIFGQVYNDANYSGLLEGGEIWDGGTIYIKLFAGTCPASGVAASVQTMSNVTPNYTFSNVAAGNYCAVLSANADPTVTVASVPAGWLNVAPLAGVQNWVVADKNFLNQNFGLFNGSIVSGRVFRDNGVAANDGLQGGDEPGIAGVALTVIHGSCVSPWCATSSDASGNFTFRLPASVFGNSTTLSIVETNLNGMLSSGGSGGATTGVYSRVTDSVSGLTVTAGSIYSGLLFADVPDYQLMTDGALAAVPGAVVFYPHRFVAGTAGTVTFSVSQLPSPAIVGWSELIYQDSNCDSVINTGDLPVTANMVVTTGQTICLLVKEFVPANAAINAQNALTISANVGATFSGVPVSFSYVRHDTTTVGQASAAGLSLVKRVSTTTAAPGGSIIYYIDYSNNSSGSLSNVVISDATPAYTTYQGATCGTLPLNFSGCSITAPALGGTGSVAFTFSGSLAPASSGTVSFTVQVLP